MEQHLKFTIGSSFQNEGFTKLSSAAKTTKSVINQSAAAINQFATQVGGMDSKAAKAASAIASLVSVCLNMNPVMAGLTTAMALVSFGLGQLKEREEEAKKKADDLRKSVEDLATKVNNRIFEKATTDAKNIGDEFERVTKHANAMTAAINALNVANAKGGNMDLQMEKLNAVISEISDEGKRVVSAEYDVRIALKNQADVTQAENAKIAAAHQAVVDEENRVATYQKQLATIVEQRTRLEENNHAVALATKEKREAWLKQIKDLKTKEAEYSQKINDGLKNEEVLRVKEQTVIAESTTAIKSATMGVTKAENAQTELIKSIEDAKEAERLRADKVQHDLLQEEELKAQERAAAEEAAAAKDEHTKLVKEGSEATKKVNEAEGNLKDAIEKYQKNLENFNTNNIYDAIMSAIGGGKSQFAKNLNQLLAQAGNIAEAAKENAVKQGIANGNIRTVDQAIKVGNEAARAARIQANGALAKRELAEAQRADRLQKMSEKAMSKADKEWLKRYKEIEAAKKAAAEAVKKREQELKEAKRAEAQKAKDIAAIKAKLDQLGLK